MKIKTRIVYFLMIYPAILWCDALTGYSQAKSTPNDVSPPAAEAVSPLPGKIATLAFFLDSIDTLTPNTLWISSVVSYRRSPSGKEWELPSLAVSFPIHTRVQMSFSVPYFRSQYIPDFQMNGIGDSFLSAKIIILNPEKSRIGIALDPTLEILGKGSLSAGDLGPGKYNVALPIILQKNFSSFNLYAEGGYITRGAAFAALGGDGALYKSLGLALNLLYSRTTRYQQINQDYGLNRGRTDAVAGLYYVFSPRVSAFVSAGRSLGDLDQNGTQYILNSGININFNIPNIWRKKK